MARSKCGAQRGGVPCDCGLHCGIAGCNCSHTFCEYGWVAVDQHGARPCGECRPIMYSDWMKSLELGVTYGKLRQRQRAGDRS